MQHYVAREIIRQRTGEMRAQARQDEAARQVRAARHGQNGHNGKQARSPREDGWTEETGAEVVPMPRVPDYVDGTYRDAEPHSHAC